MRRWDMHSRGCSRAAPEKLGSGSHGPWGFKLKRGALLQKTESFNRKLETDALGRARTARADGLGHASCHLRADDSRGRGDKVFSQTGPQKSGVSGTDF